ncbi:MAG: helix-turn-helix transcriptional regulator [Paracoccaceae bacterium]|nr:helix-turn-helix transcriptional regulator [Paracoccaceae bacterium]
MREGNDILGSVTKMTAKPFGLFCPTSKACEVLIPRWTIQILGELWGGSSRFNEIKRGLPGISPSLLTKRLKEMQENGLLERIEDTATGNIDYIRTAKAEELDPILQGLAKWAQRHIKAEIALEDRDADVLMWTLQRRIIIEELPQRRNVVRFNFADATSPASTYWLIWKPGDSVELCASDPGFDVDLYIETEVSVMSGIFLGRRSFDREIDNGCFFMSGSQHLAKTIKRWLKISIYADVDGIAKVAEARNP